jgi:hypothetical protein
MHRVKEKVEFKDEKTQFLVLVLNGVLVSIVARTPMVIWVSGF